jgi:hypothetical protein
MDFGKQFGRVAPLLIGLALIASAAVQAQTQERFPVPSIDINPLSRTSAAPAKAAGVAELTDIWFEGFTWVYINEPGWGWTGDEAYTARLKVTCTGLSPRTTYSVSVTGQKVDMKTDRNGRGTAEMPVSFGFSWWLDDAGNPDTSGPYFPFEVDVSKFSRGSRTILLYGQVDWEYFNTNREGPRVPGLPQ